MFAQQTNTVRSNDLDAIVSNYLFSDDCVAEEALETPFAAFVQEMGLELTSAEEDAAFALFTSDISSTEAMQYIIRSRRANPSLCTYSETVVEMEDYPKPFDFAAELWMQAEQLCGQADLKAETQANWDSAYQQHLAGVAAEEEVVDDDDWHTTERAWALHFGQAGHSSAMQALRMGALALLLALIFAIPAFAQAPAPQQQAGWDFAWGQPVVGQQSYYGFYQPGTQYGYGAYQSPAGYRGVQIAQQPITFGDALGIHHRIATAGQ